MLSQLLALGLVSFAVAAETDITSTTQITITPTLTTTITDWITVDVLETVYIYTNSLGLWTTTTATDYSTEVPTTTGSVANVVPETTSFTFQITSSTAPPTTSTSVAASLSDISSSTQTSSAASFGQCSAFDALSDYVDGFVSTSYSTATEEINGTPVVVEYTVLYTDVCL